MATNPDLPPPITPDLPDPPEPADPADLPVEPDQGVSSVAMRRRMSMPTAGLALRLSPP
ncbi:MAG: hypothetical protein WA134_12805 [Rhodoferax sp.]|uniref:hypothetical protein n=1 Tax=Rhodoferax sp. TaxID=50421 RepID=UPI003BB4DB3C